MSAAGRRDRRVVVVGAGSNGLVSAIHLARAGLQVTVLEHAPRPGGASSSLAATLDGFVHDHCAGFNPMTVASPAIRELRSGGRGPALGEPRNGDGAPVRRRDRAGVASGPGGDRRVARCGRGRCRRGLASDRSRDTARWRRPSSRRSCVRCRRCGPGWRSRGRYDAISCSWRAGCSARSRLSVSTCSTGPRRPTAWMSGSAQHAGLSPSVAGSGAFGFLLQLLGHSHGWPFPAGRPGRADTRAHGDRAARAGRGSLRRPRRARTGPRRPRRRRELARRRGDRGPGRGDNGKRASAGGDAAAGGSTRPADAADAHLALRAGGVQARLRAQRPGPLVGAGSRRRAAVVHVAGELDELVGAAQAGERGEVPAHPALVVGQHTLYDGSRAPDGAHTLYCYTHVPAKNASTTTSWRRGSRPSSSALRRVSPHWC